MRCCITPSFHEPPFGLHRRLDRHRLNGTEKLSGDRDVDTGRAEDLCADGGHARTGGQVDVRLDQGSKSIAE